MNDFFCVHAHERKGLFFLNVNCTPRNVSIVMIIPCICGIAI
jgi:hypothetical protein